MNEYGALLMLYAEHASWWVLQNHEHSGTGAPAELLFPSQPGGHCPAAPQQNEQLEDEIHPFLSPVPILGQEVLPGRALLQ